MGYICFKCSQQVKTVALLLAHFRRDHFLGDGGNIKCRQKNCVAEFSKFNSFGKHLKKVHYADGTEELLVDNSVRMQLPVPNMGRGDSESDSDMDCASVGRRQPIVRPDVQDMADRYIYSELKKDATVTQVTIDKVTGGITSLLADILDSIEAQFAELSSKYNIPDTDDLVVGLRNTIQVCRDPFEGFRSGSEISDYYESQPGFVQPARVFLGYRWDQRLNSNSRKFEQVLVKNEFTLCSIKSILEMICRCPTVVDFLMTDRCRNDGILADFCDGETYKRTALFHTDSIVFQLMLYIDEFETVNPLGSKTGSQKLVAVYMTVRNLPPKFNSCLANIHLVALAHATDVKTYGYNTFLKPIVDEIKEFEQGTSIDVHGEIRAVKGTLVDFSADNLGRHQVFGYLQSFRARHFCEWCTATQEEAQKCFVESDFKLRTPISLAEDAAASIADPKMSTQSGVVFHSLLNSLTYFHTLQSGPDAMHDFLEGILCIETRLIITYFIKSGLFCLDDLNAKLQSFGYGLSDAKSRPSCIVLARDDLNQSAVQMWTLGRFLPLIIGNMVPTSSDVWRMYLLLLHIMDIVFAPKVTKGMCLQLQTLIDDHHHLYRQSFQEETLKPKHHFLVHYIQFIEKSGPLVHKWALRFEGKHRYFKRIPSVMSNFKNICHSFAEKHALTQYFIWRSDCAMKQIECGPGKHEYVSHLPGNDIISLKIGVDHHAQVWCSNWVEYYGVCYSIGVYVVHNRLVDEAMPVFGEIVRLIPRGDGIVWLLLKEYETVGFDEHYHAYIISPENASYVLVKVDELYDHHPLSCCAIKTVDSKYEQMVVMRYKVI